MLGVSTQFVGSKRLGERGYADIIEAFGEQIKFDKKSGFPLNIKGEFTGKDIYINGNISSQFVSGIMMGAIIAKSQ